MSLINQMLKDIDERKGDGGQRPAAMRPVASRQWLPWLLVGVLLAALLAVLAWMQWQQSPVAVVPPAMPAATPAAETASRETTAAADPAGAAAVPAVETATAPATEIPSETGKAGNPVAAAETTVTETREDAAKPAPSKPAVSPTAQIDTDSGSMSISRHIPDPESVAADQINDGLRLFSQGRFAAAIGKLGSGLKVLPDRDDAREALYVSLRREGRIAEAEGILQDGLSDAREPARFAKLLARELAQRKALEDALLVLGINPPTADSDPEYFAIWGAIAQQHGDYARAVEIYQSLLRYFPDNSTWHAGLGIASEQTGARDTAIASYQRALQIGGLEPTVKSYIEQRLAVVGTKE